MSGSGRKTRMIFLALALAAAIPLAAWAAFEIRRGMAAHRQGQSLREMQPAVAALEKFQRDHSRLPSQDLLGPFEGAVLEQLEGLYIKRMPRTDAWGSPVLYWSDGEFALLVSTGENGVADGDLQAYVRAELKRCASDTADPGVGDDVPRWLLRRVPGPGPIPRPVPCEELEDLLPALEV